MRRFIPLTFALAALPVALFAQSAQTVPVGFTTVTIPAAASASQPSSTVISTPFYDVAQFQGAASSIDSANQVSISGASFTANQFTATPTLARFKSGNSVGRFFLITGNTTNQLTLDTRGYSLTTSAPANSSQLQAAAGDSVEILPAHTLGTLFGSTSATVPFQQGTSANTADNVLLWNGSTWTVYFFNNSANQWRATGFANQNNTVVLPDQGAFIVRRATSALSLTFLGTVPSTAEKTDLVGPASSCVGVRFPVDTTLGTLALQNLPGWLAGTSANQADNVYLWNGTTWTVYFYNNSVGQWRSTGFSDKGSTPIPTGSAMFIVRQSTAQGSNSTFAQNLPYTL